MPEITKGPPRTGTAAQISPMGKIIRKVTAAAYKDRGEWYSAEVPDELKATSSMVNQAIATISADVSAKDGRIWIRFYR